MPAWLGEAIQKGVGDMLLEDTAGIRLGPRLGLNLFDLTETAWGLITLKPDTVPAYNIVGPTAEAAASALMHFGSGRIPLASHDLETLVRAWKIIDSPIIAYTMMMDEVRISNTGVVTKGPFTSSQIFLQAIGLSPAEVINMQEFKELSWSITKRENKVFNDAKPYIKKAATLIAQEDYAAANDILMTVDAVFSGSGLPKTSMDEVKERLMSTLKVNETERVVKILLESGLFKTSEKANELNK
jgi:hypothetical protein